MPPSNWRLQVDLPPLTAAGFCVRTVSGGRIRSSIYGPRAQGQDAAEFYTQVKMSHIYLGEAA